MKKRIHSVSIILLLLGGFLSASPVIREMGKTTSFSELLDNGKSKNVTVFAINDLHGTVEEDISGKNPGIAKLNEVLTELRTQNPESIFVSAGDNYQGSALSNLSKGKIISDYFRMAGLAASTVGNHEFDWGDSMFPQWETDGNFTFIAANIIYKPTGRIPDWCKPYELYRIGGHLIAVIGTATQDTVFTTSRKMIQDYEFLDPAECVRKTLRQLDAVYHPEAVVVLSHIGSHDNRLSPGNPVTATDSSELEDICRIRGVDAVITGHSHEFVKGKCHEVPVVQALNYGRAVSLIRFRFNEHGLEKVLYDVVDLYKYKDWITEDGKVLSLVASYKEKYGAQLGESVAFVEAELSHEETVPNVTPLGYLVAGAMKKAFGVDMAVTNGGGLRKSIKAGTLTVNDMWELIPFDNTGVIVTVKGADLKKIIDHGINSVGFRAGQFAGGKVYYTTSSPEGSRVKRIVLDDGREVEDSSEYTIAVNDFMFDGGDKYDMIKPAAVKYENTYVPFRDAVTAQFKAMGTIDKTRAEMPDVLIAE